MRTKQITISDVRKALEANTVLRTDEFDEVCRLAIARLAQTTEWHHREFTDDEIRNAMRAYLQESGYGYYEVI